MMTIQNHTLLIKIELFLLYKKESTKMKKEDEYVEFKKSLSQLKEGIISLS